jgi:hypothetical protein
MRNGGTLSGAVCLLPRRTLEGLDTTTLVGLKENQRINPMQSKFVLAEGVTPPAEVHAPPGFGQIVLCRPDAWVRVSLPNLMWPLYHIIQ